MIADVVQLKLPQPTSEERPARTSPARRPSTRKCRVLSASTIFFRRMDPPPAGLLVGIARVGRAVSIRTIRSVSSSTPIDGMPDRAQSEESGYRIFVQSAASDPPAKPPARALLQENRMDLAVITAGNFNNVRDYPDAWLDYLNPEHAMIAHYELITNPSGGR